MVAKAPIAAVPEPVARDPGIDAYKILGIDTQLPLVTYPTAPPTTISSQCREQISLPPELLPLHENVG
jgi:hypothetical protein